MAEEKIKTITFGEESKFSMKYAEGGMRVWRKPGKEVEKNNVSQTGKFVSGYAMVWASFSYFGKGRLYFVDGIIDSAYYCNILSTHLIPSAQEMGFNDLNFMQDNEYMYKSTLVTGFLWNKVFNSGNGLLNQKI